MAEQSSRGNQGGSHQDDEVPPDRFAIKVSVTPDTFTKLMSEVALDVGDRPHVEPAPDGRGTLYAFAPEEQIREIEAAGYTVEVGENVSETGRQRMAEISEGDRFEGGRIAPRGLGHKPGREPEKGGSAR
jgi:hypothetical protein